MIRFIKTIAYPLAPPSGDVFTYLNGVTTQRIDPPSRHPGELAISEAVVFHSPLRRVAESLAHDERQERIALPELREIPFSLRSLCTPEEWRRERSMVVRRRFNEAFIADTLPLCRADLEREIRQVLRRLAPHASAAVVSHSFRLKLIQAFVETNGKIFRDPRLIHQWIVDDQKTFGWGEGFAVDPAYTREKTTRENTTLQ